MKIKRIYQNLDEFLMPKKALIIYGPRQAGKTTLIEDYLSATNLKYRLESGDDISVHHVLASQDVKLLQDFVSGYDLLVIDEAQRIENIGLGLKILVDKNPNLKILVSGSSSFELAGQVGEPLTGRKTTLDLYTISHIELLNHFSPYDLQQNLNDYLVFGSYPEVLTTENKDDKKRLLQELVNSYLLKDILELDKIKNSKVLLDLLRLLAFQIGSEASLSELATQLGIDTKTVARYLDLLEKSFVIYNLRGFSRNLRKEVTKKSKYYFYDLGVRNAIIANFNPIDQRNDQGALWENFLIIERLKKRKYQNMLANDYFWRTWDQKEIDLIEDREGQLFGYDFKWSENAKAKPPKEWLSEYQNAHFEIIHRGNYLEFIT